MPMKGQINRELLIVAGVAVILIIIGAVLAGFGNAPIKAPVLSATVDGGKVLLSWEGEGDVFEVYRSTVKGEPGELIATVNVSAYQDEPGPGVYYYKVKAIKDSQASPFSNEVEVEVKAEKPVINNVVPSFQGCLKEPTATFQVEGDNIGRCAYSFDGTSWSEWMTPPLQVEVPDGVDAIYIKCENNGVESDVYRYSFTVDRIPPNVVLEDPTVEEGILHGTLRSDEAAVCYVLLEDGSKLAEMEVEEGATPFQVPLPFGKYLLTFQCEDSCGNTAVVLYEAENNYSAVNETQEKGGYVMEMVINNGDRITYSRVVTLNIRTENVTHCRFTNDVDYPDTWSAWEPAENGEWEKTWLLSEDYGRKKVYMECKDGEEIVGETYDTIYYRSRSSGGGGEATTTPVAGITAYGTASTPALVEGLNSLPVGVYDIPIVEVPTGVEGITGGRAVRLSFSGVGEEGKYEVLLGESVILESDFSPDYVNGEVMVMLPPLIGIPERGVVATYTIKHTVVSGPSTASSTTTLLYDEAAPTVKQYKVAVNKPEYLFYYTFSVSVDATDEGSGIAGYVVDIHLKDIKGKEVAHYAYYWKGEDGKATILVPTYSNTNSYDMKIYVFDAVGNFRTVEESGSLPPVEGEGYPAINDVVITNLVDGMAGDVAQLSIDAENAEECAVCLRPVLFLQGVEKCTPYAPYRGEMKVDVSQLIPSYEGSATFTVKCRNGLGEASYSFEQLVDTKPPSIYLGEAYTITNPFVGDYISIFPYVVRDLSLDRLEVYLLVGEGPEWATPCPQNVSLVDVVLLGNGTVEGPSYEDVAGGVYGGGNVYHKVRVVAYDAFGRQSSQTYPEWVCPDVAVVEKSDEGSTGEESLPGGPSETYDGEPIQ